MYVGHSQHKGVNLQPFLWVFSSPALNCAVAVKTAHTLKAIQLRAQSKIISTTGKPHILHMVQNNMLHRHYIPIIILIFRLMVKLQYSVVN